MPATAFLKFFPIWPLFSRKSDKNRGFLHISPLYIKVGQILGLSENGSWVLVDAHRFLGGLSLHLNHLIASRMGICDGQFGTLPIGIFLSNLDWRQLDTSLMTSYCHFWHMSTFGDFRAVWVLLPKYGGLRKSKFSRWRSDRWSMRLGGGFRWADSWATWWYHFLGGATHLRGAGGRWKKNRHFSGHLRQLKGYLELIHWTKNQSIDAA